MSGSPFPGSANGETIDFVELQGELASAAVVDVREPSEFSAGHIPGAINLPLSVFNPDDLPTGRPIVLVCQAGARSARALRSAKSAGIENIRHYPGGTGEWRANGGAIEF